MNFIENPTVNMENEVKAMLSMRNGPNEDNTNLQYVIRFKIF